MVKSPDTADDVLSKEALDELRRRLSMLHPSAVEQIYRDAYQRCAPVVGRVAKASAIQELVTAWKQTAQVEWAAGGREVW